MLYVVITRAKIAINLFEIRMSVHFGVLEIQHGQWKVEWLEMSVSTLFAQWYTLSRPVLKLRQLPFWNIWNHFSPVLTLRSWQSAGLDNVTKKVYECLDIHLPAYAHIHTHTRRLWSCKKRVPIKASDIGPKLATSHLKQSKRPEQVVKLYQTLH